MYTPQDMANEFRAGQQSAINTMRVYVEGRINALSDLGHQSEIDGLDDLAARYTQRVIALAEVLETLDAIS